MEIQETQPISNEDMWRKIEKSHRRGKIMGGLLVIAIGSLFLARELGAIIPTWVFTWKMLLIGIGIVAAIKHKFLHPGWIVLVGIGGIFLLNDVYPELAIRPYLWPVLIILLGLFIVFKPRNKEMRYARHYWKAWHHKHHHGKDGHGNDWREMRHQWRQEARCGEFREGDGSETSEDVINSTNVMGGIKKNIISKKFKGGEVVNIFGGAHINLSQADMEGTATLELTQIFGGSKLIVPANWEIKVAETVTICGGIEDKRPVQPVVSDENRPVLVLTGTTVFGGIEINTFS